MILQFTLMKRHFNTELKANQNTMYLEKAVGIQVYDVREGKDQ